jgi:polysaccharide biosynthesis transport protein
LRHKGAHAHEGTTVHDYVRVLKRRKWILLVAVLLVPLAAVGWSMREEPVYEASSEVLLSGQDLSAAVTGVPTNVFRTPERNAETQAELAMTPAVAEMALESAGVTGMTPGELLSSASVVPSLNADLLTVSVQNGNPELAQTLATEYAQAFTAYKEEIDTLAVRRAIANVEVRLAQLEARGESDTAPYDQFLQRLQELETIETLQGRSALVVREATSAEQIAPQTVRNGAIGILLGIVLGLGLAFLREALDTRVRTAEEVAERLDLPLLGRLSSPPRRLSKDDRLVMLDAPASPDAEAFRMLRANFDFVNLERDARLVMVTSAVPAEGKSTTAANLAIALARSGRKVTLVDLDLRRPYIHRFFDLSGSVGLTQVALGRVALEDAIVSVALSENERAAGSDGGNPANGHGKIRSILDVVPSGPVPPAAGEFVATQAVAAILQRLRERSDVVIIDAPPLIQVGDAMVLTSRVDALILVARLKLLRRNMLGEVRRLLDTARARSLGFVVTGAESETGFDYGYGYDYAAPVETRRRSFRVPAA